MTHEPVKLYAAAIIHDGDRLLLTRHDETSKWHFPDGVPAAGESSWTALKQALNHDLGCDVDLEMQPCYVTEVVAKGVRHLTLHYAGVLGSGTSIVYREPMEYAWISPSRLLECYASTKIVLERLRTQL